ncbi:MAG: NAD-dependent epimerase [Bacteroidales bacterium]|nr:NAD-dependent epimerase [Bacteroidales bacterium]
MKVLVTGAAGFIGFYLVQRLLDRGDEVVGIDNLNDYYPVSLKEARLAQVRSGRFRFVRMDLADREALPALFAAERFDAVVNLAAQAGVRYSVENPWAYVDSNLVGFVNVLECCRHYPVRHLVYASSSSVYGGNEKTPFSEEDRVDDPVSLYAATKKSCELMAACYSRLYGIRATGLRFFTVYGPWGRPDMSPMLFASAILAGRPIKVFNHGDMRRDFTYIDDIVEGVVRVLDRVPASHEIYNIGCGSPVRLMDFIAELERALGREAQKEWLPMQPGDVYQTYADTAKLERDLGYKPGVTLREGIRRFVDWYLSDLNPLR